MNSVLNYEKAISLLSLWAIPEMWHDNSLYIEIKELLSKLSHPSTVLSERELLLIQELSGGVIEAILTLMDKADDFQQDELITQLSEISQLHSFLKEYKFPH